MVWRSIIKVVLLVPVLFGAGCKPTIIFTRKPTYSPPTDASTGLVPLSKAFSAPTPPPRAGCVSPRGKPTLWGTINTVQLRGVQGRLHATIRKAIRLQPGQPYRRHPVGADVQRLWKLGFIKGVWVEACKVGPDVAVTYVVMRNPRVRRIQLQVHHPTLKRWQKRTVSKLWRVRIGTPLHRLKLIDDLKQLRSAYRKRGFWSAKIEPYLRPVSKYSADVVLRIHTGPQVSVGKIQFNGNRAVGSPALRRVMRTGSTGVFSEDVLWQDMLRLRAHYYNLGYINVTLRKPHTTLSKCKRFVDISIKVTEGKPYRLGKIAVIGDLLSVAGGGILKDPKSPAYRNARTRLLQLVRSRPQQRFNRARLGKNLWRLTKWYRDHGYAYANVTPITNIDKKDTRIDLTLEISASEITTVERVRIVGHKRVPKNVILSLLDLRAGMRFSMEKLHSSRRRLRGLGFFRKVTVFTQTTSSNTRCVLVVRVWER